MFKEALIHDLKPDDFSDMVAQTVTYGLFSAATTGEPLTGLSNLSELIPNTNPFLKNLFNELTTISTTKQNVNFDELGLNDLLDILNETNMDAIMQQFGRQTGGGGDGRHRLRQVDRPAVLRGSRLGDDLGGCDCSGPAGE